MMEETTCPDCGGPMVSRKNNSTGQRFWGCKEYPKCRGARNIDGEVVTRQSARDYTDEPDRGLPSDRQRANDRERWR